MQVSILVQTNSLIRLEFLNPFPQEWQMTPTNRQTLFQFTTTHLILAGTHHFQAFQIVNRNQCITVNPDELMSKLLFQLLQGFINQDTAVLWRTVTYF